MTSLLGEPPCQSLMNCLKVISFHNLHGLHLSEYSIFEHDKNLHICFPGTRIELISQILSWLKGESRTSDVFWLHGGVGVGKSAVMKTIYEKAEELGIHAVSVHYKADPDGPTLSVKKTILQLTHDFAKKDTEYEALLEQSVSRQARTWSSSLETHCRVLLEPFASLPVSYRHLIILDGDPAYPTQLLELVHSMVRSTGVPNCVLWIVSTRYDPALHQKLKSLPGGYDEAEIQSKPDAQVRRDVEFYLRERLRGINAETYPHLELKPGQSWPSEEVFSTILNSSAYYLSHARAIFDHVFHHLRRQLPESQLLDELPNSKPHIVWSEVDPTPNDLRPLDPIYSHIAHGIAERKTLLPLIVIISAYPSSLTLHEMSLLLCEPRDAIEDLVQRLNSIVVESPATPSGNRRVLRLDHPFFLDYLLNPKRAAQHYTDRHVTLSSLVHACLSAFNFERKTRLHFSHISKFYMAKESSTPHTPIAFMSAFHYISTFVVMNIWEFVKRLSRLDYWWIAGRMEDMLRVLSRSSGFLHETPSTNENYPIALHGSARYALIGNSDDPILALLIEEGVTFYTYADIGEM
ncbi:hypothetical protein NP233_g11273 [Leucocoprinus birnbaumii]|uniref:Nephrocystin 3-like N-terminal domain-containing protein n=1 Tax=Leucocoprinus birnbaumii TaxID=56174 RepID=A0AAD5VH87_9AGAR|nr:hypothetical protein NP233_g11273 [Leucocoprinus birnbaumii]